MTDNIRFVSLAIITVDTPPSTKDKIEAIRYLAAIGMLIAERDAENNWRFSLRRHAVGAGEGEDLLLAWAASAMPETGIVVGWQLADTIIAPLLETSKDVEPEIAAGFLDRLTGLVTTPSLDLAIPHGGAGAPSFAQTAEARGIDVSSLSPDQVESAWAFGETDRLLDDVALRAIATWRLWLAESNGAGAEALGAFEAWVLKTSAPPTAS